MTESKSKILEVDRDEWIYHSMKRYSDLYMFELEFPVDAIEIIDDTSICLSGIQEHSKKCEILQLSIPPKLLPKDMEEGLCKDRDFKMISGGYASSKIVQIKPIKSAKSFLTTVQLGHNGVTIYKLGDENCAVLKEHTKLDLLSSTMAIKSDSSPGVIDTYGDRIVMGANDGKCLYEWTLTENYESNTSCIQHNLSSTSELGGIIKIKFWDENCLTFCTDKGVVCLYDLRTGKSLQDGIIIYNTKSPLGPGVAPSPSTSSSTTLEDVSGTKPKTIFSFDTLPPLNKIGIVDSYGGYENYDCRNVRSEGSKGLVKEREMIPGFEKNSGIIGNRFNIEYGPVVAKTRSLEEEKENMNEFILTGLREETVQVIREAGAGTSGLKTVFVHDGHSKTVCHALWHPISERLVFSTSSDSMLHAWQFNYSDQE